MENTDEYSTSTTYILVLFIFPIRFKCSNYPTACFLHGNLSQMAPYEDESWPGIPPWRRLADASFVRFEMKNAINPAMPTAPMQIRAYNHQGFPGQVSRSLQPTPNASYPFTAYSLNPATDSGSKRCRRRN